MLYDYAVRITYPYEQAAPIVRAWSTRVTKMVVYEHTGEKTKKAHIHLLVWQSSLQKKQLRNIAADTGLCVKGNELMSFKEYDGDETYITYMSKGKHDPRYTQGFTLAELDERKKKWVEPAKYVKQSGDEKLYNDIFDGEYDVQHYEQWRKDNPTEEKFVWLKSYVKSYVFQLNHLIWNQVAINRYKMLVYSYCYRNSIYIPEDKTGIWKHW